MEKFSFLKLCYDTGVDQNDIKSRIRQQFIYGQNTGPMI